MVLLSEEKIIVDHSTTNKIHTSSVNDNLRGRYVASSCQLLKVYVFYLLCCGRNYSGIGTSFTLHLIMMNFHKIDENKIISSYIYGVQIEGLKLGTIITQSLKRK